MKRKITIIAAVTAMIAILCYGTAAYFTATDKATNVIKTGSFGIEMHETMMNDEGQEVPFENQENVVPGAKSSKIVTIENTETQPAWVRIKITKTIALAEGTEGTPDTNLLSLDLNTEKWTEKDGFYYYNTPLEAGATTEPLFTTVVFDDAMDNMYQNSTAKIEVQAFAVQSANNGATVADAKGWPED